MPSEGTPERKCEIALKTRMRLMYVFFQDWPCEEVPMQTYSVGVLMILDDSSYLSETNYQVGNKGSGRGSVHTYQPH